MSLQTRVGKSKLKTVICGIPLPRFNKKSGVSNLVSFGQMRPSEILKVSIFYQQQNTQLTHINLILKQRVDELTKQIADSSFEEINDLLDK
jgi:hypothetical protein